MINYIIKKINSYYRNIIKNKIINLEDFWSPKKDFELKEEIKKIKNYLFERKKLDEESIIKIFSIAREVIRRKTGLLLFPSQILGALVLNEGNIAQMNTGEGKTLTAILPSCAHCLLGEKTIITSVNDYLTRRDYEITKEVYEFFDIKSCVLSKEDNFKKIKELFEENILIYSTASIIVYTYLKNNLVNSKEEKINMIFDFCINDEADLILLDEAQNALIISTARIIKSFEKAFDLAYCESLTKNFKEGEDYEVNLEKNTISLKEKGIEKIKNHYNIDNIFSKENLNINSLIHNSLKAHFFYKKNVHYVVLESQDYYRKKKIVIIDKLTGRLSQNGVYSDSIQKALETKEKIVSIRESKNSASITYQSFFSLFKKKSGMTGTAMDEEEDFRNIYGCDVVKIKPNKKSRRIDWPDVLYVDKESMYKGVIEMIKEYHFGSGRPILVGSPSLEVSERISSMLLSENINHYKLNAINHEKEAFIISKAGELWSITISTNMAGRGTDIDLSEKSKKAGGLFTIGVESNFIRRFDDQFSGRGSRKDHPGDSISVLSLEDDLFKNKNVKSFFSFFMKDGEKKFTGGRALDFFIKEIQEEFRANMSFNRQEVFSRDLLIGKQRSFFYTIRNEVLESENVFSLFNKKEIKNIFNNKRKFEEENIITKKDILKQFDDFWSRYLSSINENRSLISLKENFKKDFYSLFFLYTNEVFQNHYKKLLEIIENLLILKKKDILKKTKEEKTKVILYKGDNR